MRTSVVALPHLGDTAAIADAARRVAELTHADPIAGDYCVLWCAGVETAVREGNFDGVRRGLDLLPATRRDAWAGWLDEAENHPPAHFAGNGYTVTALQAAWSAITHTPVPDLDPPVGRFPACTCRTLCRPPSPAGCSARANPNLHFAIDDAARTVASLKEVGHRVLLHCIWTESRTPT